MPSPASSCRLAPIPSPKRDRYSESANGPSHGPKDATLTIVEFGDLQCPACKQAQPNITKLMEEEPKARLIFQNFPLESIHKWALTGAKYVDCLGRQNNDAVWKFIGLAYDHQAEVNEQNVDQMLKGYVKEAGGDPDAVCGLRRQAGDGKAGAPSPSRWARRLGSTARRRSSSMAAGLPASVTTFPTMSSSKWWTSKSAM